MEGFLTGDTAYDFWDMLKFKLLLHSCPFHPLTHGEALQLPQSHWPIHLANKEAKSRLVWSAASLSDAKLLTFFWLQRLTRMSLLKSWKSYTNQQEGWPASGLVRCWWWRKMLLEMPGWGQFGNMQRGAEEWLLSAEDRLEKVIGELLTGREWGSDCFCHWFQEGWVGLVFSKSAHPG